MIAKKKSVFSTSEFMLMSALHAMGHPISNIMVNGTRCTFQFEDSPELRKHDQMFWDHELPIDVLTLKESQDEIRLRINHAIQQAETNEYKY